MKRGAMLKCTCLFYGMRVVCGSYRTIPYRNTYVPCMVGHGVIGLMVMSPFLGLGMD